MTETLVLRRRRPLLAGAALAALLAGTAGALDPPSADTVGTVRSRARASATDSTPRATWRASSAVAPFRE